MLFLPIVGLCIWPGLVRPLGEAEMRNFGLFPCFGLPLTLETALEVRGRVGSDISAKSSLVLSFDSSECVGDIGSSLCGTIEL